MDVRVFPFSFPPIRGGAQGGASPTPTPEPSNDPYDVDDLVAVYEAKIPNSTVGAGKWYKPNSTATAKFWVTVSGINVLNSSAVASIAYDLSDLVYTDAGNTVTATVDSDSYSGTTADPNGILKITVKSTGVAANKDAFGVSGDIVFTAYDANGDALQTWTIGVSSS